MSLSGSLRDFSIPDVFRLVSLSGKSGVLHLTRDDAEGSVWFRDGQDAPDDVPIVACEVTERESVKRVVLALIDRILDTMPAAEGGGRTEAE